tara:strand:- start:1088 stop:1936 length:849 start_codon:yes stop_codon:yes gene_type:complete
MDLILGTAQFGQIYGVTNKSKNHNNLKELEKIIQTLRDNGFKKIDTAKGYGNSESMLGEIGIDGFSVTSKVTFPTSIQKKRDQLIKDIEDSISKLRLDSLDCLFAHNPDFLQNDPDGSYELIDFLKKEGLIKRFGVSIYDPFIVPQKSFIDVIQFPSNIFDRRFIENEEFMNSCVEKQCRSVFLQGLLLEDYKKLPKFFEKYKDAFLKYDNYYPTFKEKLSSCIAFILNQDFDEFLIGVSSNDELLDVISCIKETLSKNITVAKINFVKDNDNDLLDPRKWS